MSGVRDIRLVRVPGWRAAHRALDALACQGTSEGATDRAIIVPTRQAAHELRRTLERGRVPGGDGDPCGSAPVLPLMLTRAEFYEELHRRLGHGAPRLLSRADREARVWAASDAAIALGTSPPFTVRAGLVAEMIALYDAVRRNNRSVQDFERVLTDALEPAADTDRGAARLLAQTRHLVAVFREYERDLEAVGCDEHSLRGTLLERELAQPLTHVVLAVADVDAEADGLWRADFDLLLRLPGLERVDVVATDGILDSGFRERLSERLPGLTEMRWSDSMPAAARPTVLVPPAASGRRYFTHRDREEELVSLARLTQAGAFTPASEDPRAAEDVGPACLIDEILFVYARPLPYVYLARRILGAHRIPMTVADAPPLAAEPFATAMDLVFEVIQSRFDRAAVVALLASPVLTWRADGRALAPRDLHALVLQWRDSGYRGGLEGLLAPALHDHATAGEAPAAARVRRAREVARIAAAHLKTFDVERSVTEHLAALAELLTGREVRATPPDERYLRGRNAVLGLLDELRVAYRAHGDRPMAFYDVAALVRRAIEQHTFAPAAGPSGLRLVDSRAARFAEATVGCILGAVEGDWPRPQRGSIFYPTHLLRDLGFPRERDRFPAARAEFRDLVDLPRECVILSTFQLEEDTLLRASVLLEDMDDWPHLTRECPLPADPPAADQASGLLPSGSSAWLARRSGRLEATSPRFHGQAGTFSPGPLPVTKVEQYIDCPFKFFASTVLGLEEETQGIDVGLDPRRRGTLVHTVFEAFFRAWTDAGHSSIRAANLPAARDVFRHVVDLELRLLPEADRQIERTRLLGSAGAAGLGERVFRFEAERPVRVIERHLEHRLSGAYDLGEPGAPRVISLRGKADRIDLLEDGTLRIIDYKTGRPPDRDRSIQLPVYALCAERQFADHRGRRWVVGEAGFISFRGERDWVPVIERVGDREHLEDARRRFLAAWDGIERGAFPPAPAERRLCRTCAFAAVCRKDYVGEPS